MKSVKIARLYDADPDRAAAALARLLEYPPDPGRRYAACFCDSPVIIDANGTVDARTGVRHECPGPAIAVAGMWRRRG